MIYEIRHVTTYEYEAPVVAARCVMRLTPLAGPHQEVIASEVRIEPSASVTCHVGFFGATTHVAAIDVPHEELRIEARSRVRIARPRPDAEAEGVPFERVREAAFASRARGPDAPGHVLFPSELVPIVPEVTAYAAASFPAGRGVLAGARDLMARINADFAYAPGETHVATPMREAFAARRGVCQDFAHVMIAGLRGLGLPARYVSGYLRTIPPPGKPRLVGADATHAWVELWCGEERGHVGLDPTNACLIGTDHIALAVGRDYADVSPVDGVIHASGGQSLAVAVDVEPVGEG